MGESIHEMHVAGIYELMNIPYTGTATLALGTCLDKVRTKEILRAHGLPTAHHIISSSIESYNNDCRTIEAFQLLLNLRMKMPALVL